MRNPDTCCNAQWKKILLVHRGKKIGCAGSTAILHVAGFPLRGLGGVVCRANKHHYVAFIYIDRYIYTHTSSTRNIRVLTLRKVVNMWKIVEAMGKLAFSGLLAAPKEWLVSIQYCLCVSWKQTVDVNRCRKTNLYRFIECDDCHWSRSSWV